MKARTTAFRTRSLALLCALLPLATPALSEPALAELPGIDLLESAARYSEADAAGRYMYLIRFVEPGLLERTQVGAEQLDTRSSTSRAVMAELQSQQRAHLELVEANLGRVVQPSHYYLITHSGVAARLTADEAQKVSELPGVAAVEREQVHQLMTSRTPEFIGANTLWDGSNVPGGAELTGKDMTVAILDSGIVPEHPSFANDADTCGHGVSGAPDKLLSAVDCSATNVGGLCNGPNPVDTDGHGTHVASTAAGNFVGLDATPAPAAPIAGVAPCARIRAYKVCPGDTCGSADIVAGFNTMLADGDIDAMNFSISGGETPWNDNDRRMLDAVNAGIFVAASAGNTRPENTNPIGRVNHRGPWVMSVAMSTHDRVTSNSVSVSLGGPQNLYGLKGEMAISTDITGEVADSLALGNVLGCTAGGGFPAASMAGKVALISRGDCPFAEKLANAQAAGAIGGIIFNSNVGQPPIGMGGTAASIPAVMVSNADGLAVRAHLANNAAAQATISAIAVSSLDPAAGDILDSGSLRGPTPSPLEHLQKPDITGPGVNVYAADVDPTGYGLKSGTSMSGPHIAGSALLIREAQPGWTVQEVKSALQMTAKRTGFKDFVNGTPNSGPWDADDVGSGRVDLTKAARAGLVMNETNANFLAANPSTGGDVRTLNLPALRNLDCSPSCTFTRVVRNTLSAPSSWTVVSSMSSGNFDVQVNPTAFAFTGDLAETRTITVTVAPVGVQNAVTHFGAITFTEAGGASPQLHWPIALRGLEQTPPVLQFAPEALDAVVVEGGSRTLPISITNVGVTSSPLSYTFAEAPARSVVLDIEAKDTEAVAGGAGQPISLVVDNVVGTFSNIGVATQQWLWFNRFSPTQLQVPFTLQQVQVLIAPGATSGVQTGDLFDVHVWVDPDRDPTNGATLVASVLGRTVPAAASFSVINLPTGVEVTAASGDVLIGVVNRSARPNSTGGAYSVAARDVAPAIPRGRSWAAFNFPGGVAANPPVIPSASTLARIDDLGFPANWIIRGSGVGGTNCLAPSDVPWLSVTPVSGTVVANATTTVQVSLNASGLAPGEYEALLCLQTNDPARPLSVVPVSMQVVTNEQLPSISVAPASLELQAMVGSSATSSLAISNTGTLLPLNWEIAEAERVAGDNIVRFDDIDFDFPADFDGGSVKWVDGETCAGCFEPPFDLNVYAVPNMAFFWPNVAELDQLGGGVWNGTQYIVLQPGDTVGPASQFGAAAQSAATAAWRQAGGVDGYLGFRFVNPNTSQVNYGYARMTTIGTTGYPAVLRSLAYDSTGAAITIPLPVACDTPAEIPWLSAAATSGSTVAGATSDVGVTADSAGLAVDTYEATLCVRSNDAGSPLVEVPVSFNVTPVSPEIFADGFEG